MPIKFVKTEYILTLIKKFLKVFGFVRFLYDKMLSDRKDSYKKTRKVLALI